MLLGRNYIVSCDMSEFIYNVLLVFKFASLVSALQCTSCVIIIHSRVYSALKNRFLLALYCCCVHWQKSISIQVIISNGTLPKNGSMCALTVALTFIYACLVGSTQLMKQRVRKINDIVRVFQHSLFRLNNLLQFADIFV